MALDVHASVRRQQHLAGQAARAAPGFVRETGTSPTGGSGGSGVREAIVRAASEQTGELTLRDIEPADTPPQAGRSVMIGEDYTGYPGGHMQTDQFVVWPGTEEIINSFEVFPVLVRDTARGPLAYPIIKPEPSQFDPNLPPSGCGGA